MSSSQDSNVPTPSRKRKRLRSVGGNNRRDEEEEDEGYTDIGRKEEDEGRNEGMVFRGRSRVAGTMTRLLESMYNNSKSQMVQCTFSKDGIRFKVEDMSKCLQASGNLPASAFQEVTFTGAEGSESDEFSVRLCMHLLIDCLNIFGHGSADNTSLAVSCGSESNVFCMILEEGGVVTECELATISANEEGCVDDDDEDNTDYFVAFRKQRVMNRTIIKSERLKEAFSELVECPGASAICLTMSPKDPRFRMEARGSLFTLTIDLSPAVVACAQNQTARGGNDGTFIDFESKTYQMHRYRVSSLRHVFKALGVARESLIQINENGTLLVNHMLHDEGKASEKVYVNVVLFPLEAGEEEEEEEEERTTAAAAGLSTDAAEGEAEFDEGGF